LADHSSQQLHLLKVLVGKATKVLSFLKALPLSPQSFNELTGYPRFFVRANVLIVFTLAKSFFIQKRSKSHFFYRVVLVLLRKMIS